ncbi:hypothetical protein DNTS_030220 [Danionella cerebrum]|uniref:Uncharacterized protein n=1 Tax=Danionella cerebrum TaxID=2873325 RepID=A0A553Q8B4_9TELE|nr:hypothetical protein DNTS_030220 [Danionella translucida]
MTRGGGNAPSALLLGALKTRWRKMALLLARTDDGATCSALQKPKKKRRRISPDRRVTVVEVQVEVELSCCKSVGTDLSMRDIEDFISEICRLKKEVASLEAQLRDKQNSQEPLWSVRGDVSGQRSGGEPDSEMSLRLLCYTDVQENPGECDQGGSGEKTSAEPRASKGSATEEQASLKTHSTACVENAEEEREHDDEDFVPSDENRDSCSDEEPAATSKARRKTKKFICITCGKSFRKLGNLLNHEQKHSVVFVCKTCGVSCSSLKELRVHSRTHSVKKEFCCEQCGKVTFTAGNLKIHMKKHTGEKPFSCSECGKHYSSKQSLGVHQRIHTGEKPYKCCLCERRFRDATHFKSHMRSHASERPYQCSDCGQTFKQPIYRIKPRGERIMLVLLIFSSAGSESEGFGKKEAQLRSLFLPSCDGCAIGFKFHQKKCIDENECLTPSVCGDSSLCVNTDGSFYCICSEGFRDSFPSGPCEDVDECRDEPDVCGSNGTCINHQGGYSCSCPHGYSNYGNSQSQCIELRCERFDSEDEHTAVKMKPLLKMLRRSCESLSDPEQERFSGEELLQTLFNSTDDLLMEGKMEDATALSGFLALMENSIRLIGPQLRESVTSMETSSSYTEVAVIRDQTPPTGRVSLSTDSARLSTSWESVVGASYPGFAFVALVSYKDLNSSGEFFHKMKRENAEENISYQLGSRVVTAVVSNPDTESLLEPVSILLTHQEEREETGGVAYSCVFWEESEGAWSRRGCEREWSNSSHTLCSCSHLSSFAVLMALHPLQDSFELELLTRLGLVLSLICLLLCILTFFFCRSIQGTRNSIHLHLSLSLFVADLVFLCGISSTHDRVACAVVAALLHFFFLSSFFWMLLEGFQLYRMLVLVFHSTLKRRYLFGVGYGAPLLIVCISAAVDHRGFGTDRHCWLSLTRLFILSFFIPVCIIVVLNLLVFIITISLQGALIFLMHCLLHKPVTPSLAEQPSSQSCFSFSVETPVTVSCLCAAAQVQVEYRSLFRRMFPCRSKAEYTVSTKSSGSSQKPLRSHQSTGESEM